MDQGRPSPVTGSLQALESLRHFVARLEEGIYVTSVDGTILDANPALLEIFGFGSLDELRRYRAQDLFADPGQRTQEQKVLRRDGVVREFEMDVRRPDGSTRTVLDTTRLGFSFGVGPAGREGMVTLPRPDPAADGFALSQ